MIDFDLTDFLAYKAYWQKIAKEHKLIGEANYIHGELEVGQSEASDWKGKKLWAWPAARGRGNDPGDNLSLTREGSIWVGGVSDSEKYADEDTFYASCELIMKQILSKINKDQADQLLATQFNSHVVQRSDMDLSGTRFIGCELVFTYMDFDGFEYNEDHWNLT
jgi:hypothetical protein